jgi:hypothetical protein
MRLHETLPARGLVPTLTLATFVNHLNVIAWNPFLPFIAAELGVTAALLGQVLALMTLLATSLGLVIGSWSLIVYAAYGGVFVVRYSGGGRLRRLLGLDGSTIAVRRQFRRSAGAWEDCWLSR